MPNAAAVEDFLGEEVVDREGIPVGTFACYWEREERKALLLGVDIPERSGHTHIVPAQGARFNERQTYVQVGFTLDQIAKAPCLECSCEVDDAFEQRVWAFYGLPVPQTDAVDRLSQKVEAIQQQLRRIVRRDASSAPCAAPPAGRATPAAATPAPVPGQESPPVLDAPPAAETAPCDKHGRADQE